MASSIEKKDGNIVVISLEATAEEFNNALETAFKKNKNRFQIPGFRKGKAPLKLVKQYYGEGVLYDDAIDVVVNPQYSAAISDHKLDVVSRPEIDIIEIGSDKGMKYTLTVTVKPEVTLGAYENIEAPYHYHAPTDEDVNEDLNRVAERNGSFINVEDRAIEDGDTVTIDYEGFCDGVAFEGGKDEGHDLKIGSNSFIPGFEEQLIGHNIDEEFDINVKFPDEYHSEDLKGKDAIFKIKVHAIKVKQIPAIDDELAKDVSEFDTLDEYKADLLKTKTEAALKTAEDAFQNEVIKKVCENATVDVPACMVETEVGEMIEEQSMRMKYQGIELEQYLQYVGQTMDDYKKSMEPVASMRVKTNLVIEACGKAMNIEATDADVEEEAEKIGKQYNMSKEDVLTRLAGNDVFIRESIIGRKTVEEICKTAKKVDAPCECGHDHDHE